MKRFIAVLSSLLVLPAFAEVAPVYYDEVVEYSDDMIQNEEDADDAVQTQAQQNSVNQRKTINRSTSASRAISSATNSASTRTNTSSRAVASSPRSTTGNTRGTVARTAKTSRVVSRVPSTRASVTSRNNQTIKPVTARVSTGSNVMPARKTLTYGGDGATLTDSGTPYYNANNARVASASSRRSTARSSAFGIMSSSTPAPVITEEDISSTTSNLTAIAELTDYCKAQYAACMDNYCNVLDDNQGRCSCSKNIKNYAKTEAALEQATADFQDTVQKIKYIGLTGSQIEALFAETEAELAMKNNSDKSRLKNSLDAIKKKVVDVSSPTSSGYDATSGISLDLNGLLSADFTSGFDLNSFLGANSTNTSNVSNQRGEQLHKTATNRCKTMVLNSCVAQGIDANVITNSYDLEIDKQCMAYERSLNEANKEMRNNVANAANILQQARLLLTQNKNAYDLRGCVAAIDACMQDDYVCGSDYELCLDPTGKYLANGEIVKGGTPGVSGGQNKTTTELCSENPSESDPNTCSPNLDTWTSGGMYNLYETWDYASADSKRLNAWGAGTTENLGGYVDNALTTWAKEYTKSTTQTSNMALYLLQKIGYIDSNDKVHGMCASVMQQCQDYTFNSQKSTKKYIPNNEVVRQYLNTTLAKIKVQQDAILADYAESCRADVQSCLSTNGYDDSNVSSTASKTAVNACAAEITTCMSVGGYQVKDGVRLSLRAMTDWVASILVNCPANFYITDDGIGDGMLLASTIESGRPVTCTACPSKEVVVYSETYSFSGVRVQTTSNGGQSTTCNCPDGYSAIYLDNWEEITDPSQQTIENMYCIANN